MHHFFEAITNINGDALIGYFVRVVDSNGASVSLYADANLTPIASVSGVADAAKVDNDGNADFYVNVGTYRLDIYATDATTLVRSILDVPMNIDIGGVYGDAANVTQVANRSALAAIAGMTNGAQRTLSESGREGLFVFDTTNIASNVSGGFAYGDTLQGIYVLPGSDTTGASGAWRRVYDDAINVRWFGAVADCTAVGVGTDNFAAFDAARKVATNLGTKRILVPQGRYRIGSQLVFTEGTRLVGDGWHENPGSVNGVTYSGVFVFDGTILVFDPDVPGMIFYDQTNKNADVATLDYKSSRRSSLRDIMLYGGGGVTTTAHGIELRSTFDLYNVAVRYFAGCGFKVNAFTSGTGVAFGSADCSAFYSCMSRSNKLHGVHIKGNDANVIGLYNFDSALNGGANYLDDGQLGNQYVGCHAASGNQSNGTGSVWATQAQTDHSQLTDSTVGSYLMSSTIGAHTYVACYTEAGLGTKAHVISPAVIFGANLSSLSGTLTSTSDCSVFGSANKLKGAPGFTTLYAPSGNAQLTINPVTGAFSILQMNSVNAATNGLTVTAGSGLVSYDCSAHYVRGSGGAPNYTITDSTGLNIATGALKIASATIINSSGVLQAAGFPALTGDVTTVAGALTATIASNAVTYAKFQQVAATSLVGNPTGSLANAQGITLAGGLAFSGTTLTLGAITPTSVVTAGALTSSGTAGVGYSTGSGGTVTQLTSRTTGVTINKPTGSITLVSAAGSATWATFTVTNSTVAATDTVEVVQKSGANLYSVLVTAVAAGSFNVSVSAVSGTATEAPVLNFTVTKGVTA